MEHEPLCVQVLTSTHYYAVGPTAPFDPVPMRVLSYSTRASITWIVTAIRYTPEDYHIEYGLSNDTLSMRSEVVNGSTNLTSTNLAYSATLLDLRPFTQYHYRIVASNSFTASQSAVETFRTAEAGGLK